VGKGIAPDRLTSQGFGEEKPVADNATEGGRAKEPKSGAGEAGRTGQLIARRF